MKRKRRRSNKVRKKYNIERKKAGRELGALVGRGLEWWEAGEGKDGWEVEKKGGGGEGNTEKEEGVQGGVEEYWKEVGEGEWERGGVAEYCDRECREWERDVEEIPELGVGGGVLEEKLIGKEWDVHVEEFNDKWEVGGVLLTQKDAVNWAVEMNWPRWIVEFPTVHIKK